MCNAVDDTAFIWDAISPKSHMQSLAKYLTKRGAIIPAKITLTDAFAISADGITVIGTWQGTSFNFGAFVAKLR